MSTPVTLDEVLHPARIAAAWKKLRSNDGAPGEDAVTIRELEEALPRLWPNVELSIRAGTYLPAPLRHVRIPKPAGGTRQLAIPSAIDRLVQHALASVLVSRWETRFPGSSYAYRPGTGARPAIDGVLQQARILESPIALRMDIRDFFDCIPRDSITAVLRDTPCDAKSAALIHRSVTVSLAGPLGPVASVTGIPQGSPLSPLLSNAVLLPFDLSFSTMPASLFRYADYMLVLCRDETSARSILDHASNILSSMGLELNAGKTRILPLEETSFLGFGFQREGDLWHRRLPEETRDACLHHLRCMEDSAKSTGEMSAFLRQWAAYFLPLPEDRGRHAGFLRDTAARFRLPQFDTEPSPAPRSCPPPGFSYDGYGKATPRNRLGWATWFLLRRIRFGLHFRRRGICPVPSGIHITIAGHRIYFRL